jgi:hypothetical protein
MPRRLTKNKKKQNSRHRLHPVSESKRKSPLQATCNKAEPSLTLNKRRLYRAHICNKRRRTNINKKSVLIFAIFSILLISATTQFTKAADYTKIGVIVGTTADYTTTGFAGPDGTTIVGMHLEVTAIYLTNVTFSATATLSNQSTLPMGSYTENVTSGSISNFFWVLAVPELNVGDPVFYSVPVVITSQEGGIFAGATRTVDYAFFNAGGGTIFNLGFDKATGLMVSLDVTGTGQTGSATLTSTNLWAPTTPELYVDISPLAPTIIADQDVTFTATAHEGTPPYATYEWQVNGTLEQSSSDPTFSMTHVSQGSYIVTVTVTDNAQASANATTMLTANPPLSVQIFHPNQMILVGQNETFYALPSGGIPPYAYAWTVNGTVEPWGVSFEFSYEPLSAGVYIVNVTVTDSSLASASATTTLTATVPGPLSVSISPTNATILLGQGQVFTASASGGIAPYYYNWEYSSATGGSGGMSGSSTFTLTPGSTGVYLVDLTVTDSATPTPSSATDNTVLMVTIQGPLSVELWSLYPDVTVGQSAVFYAYAIGGASPFTYDWYVNGSLVLTQTTDVYTYYSFVPDTPGVYIVNVTVTDNALASANTITTLTVSPFVPLSPVYFSPSSWNPTIALGDSEYFQANWLGGLPPFTCHWYVDGSLAATQTTYGSMASYSFWPRHAGSYIVDLTVTDSESPTPVSVSNITTLTVTPVPLLLSISPTAPTIFLGDSQVFTASVSGGLPPYTTYDWYVDGTLKQSSYDSTFSYKPLSAGVYIVSVTVSDNELPPVSASNSSTLTVITPLQVSISPTAPTIFLGMSQLFTASVSGGLPPYTTYVWYVNSTQQQNSSIPIFSYKPSSVGVYIVNVTVTDSESPAVSVNAGTTLTVAPIPPEYLNVGVKVGDNANYSVSIPGIPINRMYMVITDVSGTIVSGNVTMYLPDGTEAGTLIWTIDISIGSMTTPFPLLIASDLTADQPIYAGFPITINDTISMMIGGATRAVNHVSLPNIGGQAVDAKWDKLTGLLVKFSSYNFTSQTWTRITLTSTSLWIDVTPPSAISDLATSSPTATSITLTWTAPGDDGMSGNATGYILKYSSTGPITDSNWDSATTYAPSLSWTPAKNGTKETHVVSGLTADTTYWFAIKAHDEVPNNSSVSNYVSRRTSDIVSPAAITDLTVSATTNSTITLTWSAPGDNGMLGNATGYWIKYSRLGPINASNWASATNYTQTWIPAKNGTTETRVITGLYANATYWFAIKAYDKASNYGGISNSPSGRTSGVFSTTPAEFFGQNGFSIWTNGSSVVVTSLTTQPSGTGSPPTGKTPFIYFEMQGSMAPGSHVSVVKLYYNITKVHELGLNETTLALYTWNSTTSHWDSVPTTNVAINSTCGLLTAYVSHFSYFAVFATTPSAAGLTGTTIIMIGGAVAIIVVVLAVVLFLRRKRY